MVIERCGISEEILKRLMEDIRRAGRIALVTGTGVMFAPHALTTELLRWSILAATGSLDQPGGMWFDTGWLSKLDERKQWEAAPVDGAVGPGPKSRPELVSITGERPCAAIVDEIEAGNLKALVIGGGNPLTAFPEPDRLQKALQSLEVLAVADVVSNPLTKIATHVLPALHQLERADILFFNGRIAYAPPVLDPIFDRRAAWRAYARIAQALGLKIIDGMDIDNASEQDLLAQVTSTARFGFHQLLDAGISGLEAPARSNWVLASAIPGGRWRIAPPTLRDRFKTLLEETAPKAQALTLVSRRQIRHLSSTHYVSSEQSPDRPTLLMTPEDAASLGIEDGDRVSVSNIHGEVGVHVELDLDIRPGVVSLPHGWHGTNVANLVSGTEGLDHLTGMPLMSAIPVEVRLTNKP